MTTTVAEAVVASAPRLPTLHSDLVHASTMTPELNIAIAAFMQPYVSVTDALPAMRDVYLSPSTGVDADGRLRGYVASVVGSASATAGVLTPAIGTGTTWLRVTSAEGRRINDDDLERAFEPLHSYTTAGMRVSVVSGLEYPSIVHYVVVHGNDAEAAAALVAQATKSRASVDDLMSGSLAAAYAEVIKRSYEARLKSADEFMRAHGLELDETVAAANQLSDFIVHSPALSEVAKSSRLGAKNVHLVYSDVADPSHAHTGVLMYRGPIAGYTHFAGAAKTVKGRASVAWSNAELADTREKRPFSMMPVDTGTFLGTHTRRTADRHKNTSAVIRNVHQRRVKWSGAVRSYNPLAEVVMHAPNDAHVLDALSRLGVPPGGAVVPQTLDVVVTELPAIDTCSMTLAELVSVASKASEKRLPVDTGTFVRMLGTYPSAGSLELASVFSSQADGAVNVDVELLRDIAASQVTGKKKNGVVHADDDDERRDDGEYVD